MWTTGPSTGPTRIIRHSLVDDSRPTKTTHTIRHICVDDSSNHSANTHHSIHYVWATGRPTCSAGSIRKNCVWAAGRFTLSTCVIRYMCVEDRPIRQVNAHHSATRFSGTSIHRVNTHDWTHVFQGTCCFTGPSRICRRRRVGDGLVHRASARHSLHDCWRRVGPSGQRASLGTCVWATRRST